jgi:multidrug efflux pump subunit AcrA (membrane-fusion protein)
MIRLLRTIRLSTHERDRRACRSGQWPDKAVGNGLRAVPGVALASEVGQCQAVATGRLRLPVAHVAKRIRQATGLTYGLCLLALLAGCRGSKADAPANEAADDKSDPPPVVKVEVQPIVRTSLDETIEVLGVAAPLHNRTARLTTAIDGRVAEILPLGVEEKKPSPADDPALADPPAVKSQNAPASDLPAPGARAVEGQLVSRRQVIVRLDDSLSRAAVAKAEGALAEAEATAAALNTPRSQQLEAAEAAASSATSALAAAESQLKRLQQIADLVGSSQLADAQTALEKAKSDKHAADAHLAELSALPAERKAAELHAKIQAARADLVAAQTQLNLCEIRSPIEGRLGSISVYLGQSLPVGTPIATVTDLRQIQIEAAVPAKRIRQVEVGQPATIAWTDAGGEQSLAGKVTFIGHDLEPGSGCFPARILVDNSDERLRSGVHVQARIVIRHAADVLAVPRDAVIEESDEPYLFLAVAEGSKRIAKKTPIKLGIRSGNLVQVEAKELAAGASIVTVGNYFLPDKAELQIDASADKGER